MILRRFIAASGDTLVTVSLWWTLFLFSYKGREIFAMYPGLNSDRMLIQNILTMGGMALGVTAVQVHGFLTVGQSIGKRLLSIKVVQLDGSVPTVRHLFWRTLIWQPITLIPLIGWLIWLIDGAGVFGAEQRCLHDRLAKTRVVSA